MINYGIVGVGGFAATWVRCLTALEERGVARVAAFVERDQAGQAEAIAALEARGVTQYMTFDEMLEQGRGRLDVIGLPVGIAYHEPLAVRALESGYNVHVEKPLAGTVQGVANIAGAAERAGRWVAVGYQCLYSPTMRWICERLASGALGGIQEARSVISWPRASSYYGRNAWAGQLRSSGKWILDGPATNATAHYMNNLLYMVAQTHGAPAEIATVHAELYRAKPIPSYDTSCIEMHMATGERLLHLVSHSCAENKGPHTMVICQKGTICWVTQGDVATIEYTSGQTERFANPDPEALHALPFAQMAQVLTGEAPRPLCGIAEAAGQVLAINLAFESSGRVHLIPEAHVEVQAQDDGSTLRVVPGMTELLYAAYDSGRMLSEMDVPWAASTATVSSEGYARFPRDEGLAGWLDDQT